MHPKTTSTKLIPIHYRQTYCYTFSRFLNSNSYCRLSPKGDASPTFDINWPVAIVMRDNSWVSQLRCSSNKRDAAGCFLVDYIALHPYYESLSSATLAYSTPVFKPGPEGHLPYRALIGEDHNGTTALHNLSPQSMRPLFMGLWDLQDETSNLLRNPNNMNAYDCT